MKYFIVLVITVLLSACNNQDATQQQGVTQQQKQESQEVLIKPYTKKIPLVGDEKMKPKDWSQKAPSK